MIKSLAILLVAGLIVLFEVPPLVKKKQKKELVVFTILLIIGVSLSIIFALGITIPNPMDFISFIFRPLSEGITRLLK